LERLTYTVSEVAQLLGVSRSKAYELVAEGQIPILQLRGRRKLVARATVERLLDPPPLPDRHANDHRVNADPKNAATRATESRSQHDRERRPPSPHHTVAPGVPGSDPAISESSS
jgi:excisionase family DNA binding protein